MGIHMIEYPNVEDNKEPRTTSNKIELGLLFLCVAVAIYNINFLPNVVVGSILGILIVERYLGDSKQTL